MDELKGTLKVGRPPNFKTPEDMIDAVNEYFESVSWEIEGKKFYKPTMTGLGFAIGKSRSSIVDYKKKTEFSHIIKSAKQIVEIALETGLYSVGVAGLIFNLKNNFGWSDKQEIVQEVKTTGYVVQTEPLSIEQWQEMGKESQKNINDALEQLTGGKDKK